MQALSYGTSCTLLLTLIGCSAAPETASVPAEGNGAAAAIVAEQKEADAPKPVVSATAPQDDLDKPALPRPHIRQNVDGPSFELAVTGLPESGMWKCDPAFGDVNGDGRLDLAVHPRLGLGPRIWLNMPASHGQTWVESSEGLEMETGTCGGGLELVDVNHDDVLDLVVADHCRGVYVFLGDGEGGWEATVQGMYPDELIPAPGRESMYLGAEDVTVGDIDGDGHADLLVGASDEGGVSVYLGDGTGENWRRVENTLPNFGWTMRVRLHDMNGDGTLDAVLAHSDGPRVWLNDGSGNFTTASEGLPTPVVHGLFVALDVADLNRDNRPDILVANWSNGPEIYLQNDDGTWTKTADMFPDLRGGAYGVAAGKINSDDSVDLFVSGRMKSEETGHVRGVFTLFGDGQGAWNWSQGIGLPETGLGGMSGVGLADLNGDGVNDLVACSGLIVESDPARTTPVLPARILVWITQPGKSGNLTRVDEQ